MKLYMAVPTDYARHVIDHGFVGIPYNPIEFDEAGEIVRDENGRPVFSDETRERCEFRDIPPSGLAFSRTTEIDVEETDDQVAVTISGGPTFIDDPGDFVLMLEVPTDFAREREMRAATGRTLTPEELQREEAGEVPWGSLGREAEPVSWPFREFWLTPDEANRFLDTLTIYDSNDGEEVRPDLVGR